MNFINLDRLSGLLSLAGLVVLALGIIGFHVMVYRVTFHPLANFPGPTLAAATGLYEAYYQCLKDGGGRYWVEIEEMHKRYGAILLLTRANCELHSVCFLLTTNWTSLSLP